MTRKNAGFTLVELLVVLGIIGILTSALIFAINPVLQLKKGRDATRKTDLDNLRAALEIYRQAEGEYPSAAEMSSCGEGVSIAAGGITFLNSIPCDPVTGEAYAYSVNETAPYVVYTMYACLENENDPDISPVEMQGDLCENDTAYIKRNP